MYQLSIGAIGLALASEIPTPRLRAPTLSLVGVTQGISGWVIGFVSPYMINPDQGNLGAKVGFVFLGFGIPLCILIWFFVPETKGLSYDDVRVFPLTLSHATCMLIGSQMDYLFNRRVNSRRFQSEIAAQRTQGTSVGQKAVLGKEAETSATEVE